jgi:FKBP-type peptidyl-prolyl cis-trans isomerase FkpA
MGNAFPDRADPLILYIMKKIPLILSFFGFLFYILSCTKATTGGYYTCSNAPISQDTTALQAFAKLNGLTVVQDTSGLYYQIISPGNGGSFPMLSSTIYVTYTGTLLNGTIFDSTTNASSTGFVLSNLMKAWQIGLPKIQAGGHIKLLCPSALAYGCLGAGTYVPPNTPVYYDVSLVSFK